MSDKLLDCSSNSLLKDSRIKTLEKNALEQNLKIEKLKTTVTGLNGEVSRLQNINWYQKSLGKK